MLLGRGRALDAKSILMASDQNVVKAHEQNIIREQLMEEALDYVDAQPPQWLQLKVKVKNNGLSRKFLQVKTAIRIMREERILAEALKQESLERQRNSPNTYLLLCGYVPLFVVLRVLSILGVAMDLSLKPKTFVPSKAFIISSWTKSTGHACL